MHGQYQLRVGALQFSPSLSRGASRDSLQLIRSRPSSTSCAAKAEADFLLTRDRGDFRGSHVPVLSPAEFVALHGRVAE